MNDKDKEINELKERLNKLEDSQNPGSEELVDSEHEKLKKELEQKYGWVINIFIFILFMAGILWLFSDDSSSTSSAEEAKLTKQQITPVENINKQYREQILATLTKQDFEAYWSQDSSLWIENPGYSSAQMETFGYKLCDITKGNGMKQSYIITFWQSLRNGPNGQILKVNCF